MKIRIAILSILLSSTAALADPPLTPGGCVGNCPGGGGEGGIGDITVNGGDVTNTLAPVIAVEPVITVTTAPVTTNTLAPVTTNTLNNAPVTTISPTNTLNNAPVTTISPNISPTNTSTVSPVISPTIAPVNNNNVSVAPVNNVSVAPVNNNDLYQDFYSEIDVANANSNEIANANSNSSSNENNSSAEGGSATSTSSSAGGNATSENANNNNINLVSNDLSSDTNTNNSSAAGGNATGVGGDSINDVSNSVVVEATRASAATAFAAGLTASAGTCMGSSSLGGQGVGFGLSLGSTWTDSDCNRRRYSAILLSMGQDQAALQLLCKNSEVSDVLGEACK